MPFLLRKIRKARWLVEEVNLNLLQVGDLPSDPLGDLVTKHNELSVWEVDTNKTNLDRLLAALASGGESLSNLDYALLDQSHVLEIGIEIRQSPGQTADSDVNNQWHRDLVELSAKKLVELARQIQTQAQIDRRSLPEVKRLVAEGVDSKQIDRTKLKPEVLKKLT